VSLDPLPPWKVFFGCDPLGPQFFKNLSNLFLDVFKTLLLDEKPEERRAIIEGCSSLAMFGLLEFLYTNTLQNKDGNHKN
jgi:hypothetical protein